MPRAKHDLFWRCELCHTGGAAKGTGKTRADKALDSMLAHHRQLSPGCKANFMAIPQDGRDYWLFTMKDAGNVDLVAAEKPTSAGVITVGAKGDK